MQRISEIEATKPVRVANANPHWESNRVGMVDRMPKMRVNHFIVIVG